MKKYTEYNPTTGKITRVIATSGMFIPEQGLDYIEGHYSDLEYLIVEGEPQKLPNKQVVGYDYWELFRVERNLKLSNTDWTQVEDAPVNKALWAEYRQKLRDLPSVTVDPQNPEWPLPPEN